MTGLPTSSTTTLLANFPDRETAEAACAALRNSGLRSGEPRLAVGGPDGGYSIAVSDLPIEAQDAAQKLFIRAGAADVRIADGDPHKPRPVQPGFTDAPPGIVPEPAPDLPGYEEPKGRFAEQLDELPESHPTGKR